jgi:hypothetical protein
LARIWNQVVMADSQKHPGNCPEGMQNTRNQDSYHVRHLKNTGLQHWRKVYYSIRDKMLSDGLAIVNEWREGNITHLTHKAD